MGVFYIPVCEAEMLHRDQSQFVLLAELSLHLNLELIQYLCEGLIFFSHPVSQLIREIVFKVKCFMMQNMLISGFTGH